MVDIDDVGNAGLFGGFILFIIFLAVYLIFSVPEIDKCHEKGGQIVKIEGQSKCISNDALKEIK